MAMKTASIIATFILIAGQAYGLTRKTVCTMTLNSPHEAQVFKSSLPKDQFDFVELVDPQSENWLMDACAKNINCDMLIVSGHFGGSFFGESEAELSLETLEQASCEKSCQGILKNPKEVFLFGCNTLAGKDKDSRTPDQYRRVLINDGFSAEEASTITAFRYSPFGSTFSDRMRRVFSKTPQIYGFSSIAPAGENIEDMLRNYLGKTGKTYFDRLVSYSNSANPNAENKTLAKSLKDTNFVQTSGDDKYSLPVCYLNSNQISTNDKTKWIQNALSSNDFLTYLPDIAKFLEPLFEHAADERTPEENLLLQNFTISSAQKDQLLAFFNVKETAFLSTQITMLNLMNNLNWVTEEFRLSTLKKLVLGDLSVFDWQKYDLIRSEKLRIPNLSFDEIPATLWKNRLFILSLKYLQPTDSRFPKKLLEISKNPIEKDYFRLDMAAAETLAKLHPLDDNILFEAINMLQSNQSQVNSNGAEILIGSESRSPQVLRYLFNAAHSNSSTEQKNAIKALSYIGTNNLDVHRYLIQLFQESNSEIQIAISESFQLLIPQDIETQEFVSEIILRSTDHDILTNLMHFLDGYRGNNKTILSALIKLLKLPNKRTRYFAIRALTHNTFKDQDLLAQIIETVISKDILVFDYPTLSSEIAAYIDLFPSRSSLLFQDFNNQPSEIKISLLGIISVLKMTNPEIREIVENAFQDSDFNVRREAVATASDKFQKDIPMQILIASSLNDRNSNVQIRAKYALIKLKPNDPTVLQIITDSANRGNSYAKDVIAVLNKKK